MPDTFIRWPTEAPARGDDCPSPSAYIATNDRRELLRLAAVMLHRALDAPRHDEWPLDVAADLLTRAGEPGLAVRADAFASDREIVELMGEVEAARVK